MKRVLFGLAVFSGLFIFNSTSLADEAEGEHELDTQSGSVEVVPQILYDQDSERIINEFLEDESVDELVVVDDSLAEDEDIIEDTARVQARGVTTSYRVVNVKGGKDYVGGAIASSSGAPNITLRISQTKSISTSFSGSFGASAKVISAGVGWNVTGSTSISISGTYKIPSKVGKRQVKTCTLKAHTIYKTKTYTVQSKAWNAKNWSNRGSGAVKKAYGISFKKNFSYK